MQSPLSSSARPARGWRRRKGMSVGNGAARNTAIGCCPDRLHTERYCRYTPDVVISMTPESSEYQVLVWPKLSESGVLFLVPVVVAPELRQYVTNRPEKPRKAKAAACRSLIRIGHGGIDNAMGRLHPVDRTFPVHDVGHPERGRDRPAVAHGGSVVAAPQ
jgi:hypothetical protein